MAGQDDPLVSLAHRIFAVLDEAGITNVSEELRSKLAEGIADLVETNLNALTAKHLTGLDAALYDDLIVAKAPAEEMARFLAARGIYTEDLLPEAFESARATFLARYQAERAAVSATAPKPSPVDPEANTRLIWNALNAIIDDGGAGDVDQKARLMMVQDLERQLQGHVDRLIRERLGEDAGKALTALIEAGATLERVRAFLTSKGIDHQAVLTDALKYLRSRYVKER